MARPRRPRSGRDRVRGGTAPSGRPTRTALPVTRQQYDVLLDSLAHARSGRHVEQLTWRWQGPLDPDRLAAAWQSVIARETVLRSSFAWGPTPRLVVHDRARIEVVRHPAGSVDFARLLAEDRLRGFDLRRPGPLRVTLVDVPGRGTSGPAPSGTRMLLTFHHALLDTGSVFVLLEEFCRAYLADGVLPGGERRPDLRDWTRWLDGQDPAPARELWSRTVPAGDPALLPLLPGPDTRQTGCGRAEVRLSVGEAGRLHRWAAARALPDSSTLQAVWALLIHRAQRVPGSLPVGFGVTVSGRGIPLDGVERLVGPLRTSLPMVVTVDPEQPLGRLLAALRDRALDMAAYEWVAIGQIHEWTGRAATGGKLVESLVAVAGGPRPPAGLRAELGAAGVRLEMEHADGAHPAVPVALLAHRSADGSLRLSVVHDRARVSDRDARLLATHCARLLRLLPVTTGGETVGEVLSALGSDMPPVIAPPRHSRRTVRLRPRPTGSKGGVDRAPSES
ncbi:condensation domain-containing protein [Streptomyces sp. MNU76]|uniref:condensation domain-containing protein n=1 Tax=Streptomyces sp. MNU76 TaxID=2560026 RepID=UPI001E4E3CE9|nr:condensation domain-containing protein [Streptomyces sp. MNU76]MCC9711568.1 condensation domain-containing protein [Streptomyces sp. MNU76]